MDRAVAAATGISSLDSASFDFPYDIALRQRQSGDAFDIHANVSYSRDGSLNSCASRLGVSWSHHIAATAVYQRGENYSLLEAQNKANEDYWVRASAHRECYKKHLEAI